MSWGVWIGLGWAVFVSAITIAIQYGYNKKQFESIFKTLDDQTKRDKDQDAHIKEVRTDLTNQIREVQEDLTKHSNDMDKHWTVRERLDREKQLDRIEGLIRESLTDRANITRALAEMKDHIANNAHPHKP
jgi:uncharacterized membrane protein YhiD involved in acid resistance